MEFEPKKKSIIEKILWTPVVIIGWALATVILAPIALVLTVVAIALSIPMMLIEALYYLYYEPEVAISIETNDAEADADYTEDDLPNL